MEINGIKVTPTEAKVYDALVRALEDCLREHGGFTIKGECERCARAALALAKHPTPSPDFSNVEAS